MEHLSARKIPDMVLVLLSPTALNPQNSTAPLVAAPSIVAAAEGGRL